MSRAQRWSIVRALAPSWPDEARAIVQGPVLERLARAAPLRGRCLNAGYGEGLFSPLLESFAEVSLILDVDIAGPGARSPNRRHRAVRASLTQLPFARGSIDTCLCSETLEHIADDEQAVSELARVIRPGGHLVVSVPMPPSPPDPLHVREGYRTGELSCLMARHGFEVIESAVCLHGLMRFLVRTWRWQFDTLGHARRNYFPRFLLRSLAHLDRRWQPGRPWDLAVLALRTRGMEGSEWGPSAHRQWH